MSVIKSVNLIDNYAAIRCTIADPSELARIAIQLDDHHRISGLLLPSKVPAINHGDGTCTHVFVFRPFDERMLARELAGVG